MALYFHFNETTGDLVYSDKATYDVEGYKSLGEQTNMNPSSSSSWVFNSQRSAIVTVSKDKSVVGKIAGLTDMRTMFATCTNLTSLDLSGFDTSAVTSMNNMFNGCSSLTSLDLSGFDTSAVTDMGSMFGGCTNLTSLDLSGFDTSAVTSLNGMFIGCTNLTSLDLSGFDTSAVMDMRSMFATCSSLTSLDLSGFDTSAVMNMSNMFNGCSRLRLITISDKMTNVLSQLPADQYYPAAGGSPVAKASLTAGTWVRDEADLTKVTSIVQQAQMSQAISRRIGGVRRDLAATTSDVKELQDSVSQGNWNAEQEYYWCRCGNVVVLQVCNISLISNETKQLGSLPDTIRPTSTLPSNKAGVGILATNTASTPHVGYLYVNSDGTLTAWAPTSGQYSGQLAYLSATE